MEFLKANLDLGLIGVLGFMSFLTITFTVERYLYFARVDLGSFARAEDLEISLTRYLTVIASVGANAPYVGLLGTVLGILITFNDIGRGGVIETSVIMVGLALALKATAFGLLVAIPSIVFYNALLRRVDVLKARWGQRACA
ncbi:TonB-system energizer ExbB [uncultured Thiodictyon sp.]|uniref:TonB-system energizer ExbB n=1 Tax=uncultured Thiodictyon sp. TaxID=1846217 RepID=UPI0025F157ED|nr:TonB-system energizer ExbB [uncultured Thiodictyon sp.]